MNSKAIRISFALLCFFVLGYNLKSQTTITIGDQNSSSISEKYPFDDYYNYSWSNVVYLQSEIGQAGQISKIAFKVYNNPGGLTMNNQIIYMRHTSVTGYTVGTYPGTTGFTQVYN